MMRRPGPVAHPAPTGRAAGPTRACRNQARCCLVRRPGRRGVNRSRRGVEADMSTIARITGGVDTHLNVHVAAALNDVGGVPGTASFPTTTAGYRQLLQWLSSFGEVTLVGVEGTGS